MGTKSVLFGVHAFWWHPFSVALAWRRLYRKWPDRYEWVAIFCHDLGYWGCPNMDGPKGRQHPEKGAGWAYTIAEKLARWSGETELRQMSIATAAFFLSLQHSREYSKVIRREPSKLCWADKYCCFYDPPWFYLLRAHLSGEIYEFRANAKDHIPDEFTFQEWYRWYRLKVLWLPEIQNLLVQRRHSCIFPL